MIFLVINKNSGAVRASEINLQPAAASCPNHYWESSAALSLSLSLSQMHMLCLVTQSFLTLWTQWTVTCHAPLSMGFSRQDYWNGLTCPLSGDPPDLGIEPELAGGFFTTKSHLGSPLLPYPRVQPPTRPFCCYTISSSWAKANISQ